MIVAGLLLAAGAGTRLGIPKALVELGAGTLVERGARTLTEAGCEPVVVVCGAGAKQLQALDLHGAALLVNEAWESGQASSLATGLRFLEAAEADAAVIALVDQPFVSAAAVRRLAAAYARARPLAVVATYGGAPRNPVVLDRSVWSDALALARPDEGARVWLRTHAADVLEVACDDVASPTDVDVPADLAAAATEHPPWS